LSQNYVVFLYVRLVVFGVNNVFEWFILFVNFIWLFHFVGCIVVCVCCLRRAHALQNRASGGGAIFPRQRALQNGAPDGEKSLRRAVAALYTASNYSTCVGDALRLEVWKIKLSVADARRLVGEKPSLSRDFHGIRRSQFYRRTTG
jgi:hypothetical protein